MQSFIQDAREMSLPKFVQLCDATKMKLINKHTVGALFYHNFTDYKNFSLKDYIDDAFEVFGLCSCQYKWELSYLQYEGIYILLQNYKNEKS